jgi:hypothetical protein
LLTAEFIIYDCLKPTKLTTKSLVESKSKNY